MGPTDDTYSLIGIAVALAVIVYASLPRRWRWRWLDRAVRDLLR